MKWGVLLSRTQRRNVTETLEAMSDATRLPVSDLRNGTTRPSPDGAIATRFFHASENHQRSPKLSRRHRLPAAAHRSRSVSGHLLWAKHRESQGLTSRAGLWLYRSDDLRCQQKSSAVLRMRALWNPQLMLFMWTLLTSGRAFPRRLGNPCLPGLQNGLGRSVMSKGRRVGSRSQRLLGPRFADFFALICGPRSLRAAPL